MENVNGQLQSKYQKIATEYSKIRAQVNVLKKAVIDEQNRNAELLEQFKEKEVEVRRSEQELDSLTFRNQQLTKRITVLQEELDHVQNKGKKNRTKSSESKVQIPPTPNHILDEEFQKKIVENAQLCSQLVDKDSEIEALNERIQRLEYKLDMADKTRIESDNRNKEIIERLEREKLDLQRKLADKQKQEETVSWSSSEGRREGNEYELKVNNHRVEPSPYSSPSASRRSSKSTVELGPRKTWSTTQEESSEELDFAKLAEVEKEMNHWKAHYHVLKIKYDDMVQKQAQTEIINSDSLEPIEITNMIGSLQAPFAIPEEIEARENKMKDYFFKEIDRLVNEKQLCYVKTIAIAANAEVLNVHLDNSETERARCQLALSDAVSKINIVQEDQEVQEGNYKTQLSTMTEHLANMNDKLIKQTEEIQQLKFQLVQKANKKGK